MDYSDLIVLIMEIIGTVAFASSGAMLAIRRRMDLFGVNVLGVTTAVGGGLIRDLILGVNPPMMFQHSVYAVTAVITSTVLFLAAYMNKEVLSGHIMERYDRVMLICDTIGLGIFTVVGCHAAIAAGYGYNRFLTIFVGVLTGVGGGMLRDIMAGTMPYIFVKHVYAVASLAGAFVYAYLASEMEGLGSMLLGAAVVMTIRFLAAHYRWNLPRIK